MTASYASLATAPVLREDTVTTGRTSDRALAIGLLIAAVNLTTFDFTPEVAGQTFATDWQILLRLGLCSLCGLYGFLYLPCTVGQLFRFPGAWGTLFGLWALVTIPTSASPLFATASAFSLGCVILFAPAVLFQLGGRKTLETLVKGLLLFVGVNWFLYFAVPRLGRSAFDMANGDIIYRFGNDAQQLGLQIAWAAAFLLVLTFAGLRSWRTSLFPLAVMAITLPLTQSRTAILATATTTGIVIWNYMKAWQRWCAVGAGGFLVAMVIAMFAFNSQLLDSDAIASRISRSGEADEIRNFTGRDVIWSHAWEKICEAPLVGWGFGCSRFVMDDDNKFSFQPNHAHNLFLNVTLCLGFPGAILLLAMVGHQLVRIVFDRSLVPMIATALILVAGISEPLLFGPMPRSATVIWLIAIFWQQMQGDESLQPDAVAETL